MVVLGKIAEPYGVRGWVKILPFADEPAAWAKMPRWWIGTEVGGWREVGVSGSRLHGNVLVSQFDGVGDRDAAEQLKGLLVAAPRDALPATAQDEFYWADLIGLEVVNLAGEKLGHVESLIATGANDVLRVIADDGTERLLPFVDAVVSAVDTEAGSIHVDWGSDW